MVVFVFCVAACVPASAQTLSTILDFDGTNGQYPAGAPLTQGTDGQLYGTTSQGGNSKACSYGCGTVFEVTRDGVLTTLANLDGTNSQPGAELLQATNWKFYGSAYGINTEGTIFVMTPAGEVTTLVTGLSGAVIQASDGNLYGTSYGGGIHHNGAIFEISPLSGKVTTLHSFNSEGWAPYGPTGLVQASDGNFYGMTFWGGKTNSESCTQGCGAVFRFTPAGELTILHAFCSSSYICSDGAFPTGTLLQAADGNLYGTTSVGGTDNQGTAFKITLGGKLTTLYSFCALSNCFDGSDPNGSLVQATDGNLYGTTSNGGIYYGGGTIFQLTTSGILTTLLSFDESLDGSYPSCLTQSTNGTFYGTTAFGGSYEDGTVFSFDMGLEPFVIPKPPSGEVGAAVAILGSNLARTTSVTFNGTAAAFTVVSGSEIKTAVPTGATTGTVEVTTPSGTLKSNVSFEVTE